MVNIRSHYYCTNPKCLEDTVELLPTREFVKDATKTGTMMFETLLGDAYIYRNTVVMAFVCPLLICPYTYLIDIVWQACVYVVGRLHFPNY